jgi:hypothetical protein
MCACLFVGVVCFVGYHVDCWAQASDNVGSGYRLFGHYLSYSFP